MRSKRAKEKDKRRERERAGDRYSQIAIIRLSFACWQTQFDRPSERVDRKERDFSPMRARERESEKEKNEHKPNR